MSYYADKIDSLRDIFGVEDVEVGFDFVRVANNRYLVSEDVILVEEATETSSKREAEDLDFSLSEHELIFKDYFDLVDLEPLSRMRTCDLGCGAGLFTYFLAQRSREVVAVDMSDAIFDARRNLKNCNNIIFIRCDLRRLPLREDFCYLLCSLGVLHHLSTPGLDEVRKLRRFAPELLIYVYYAMDNRPIYFRWAYLLVIGLRSLLWPIRHSMLRHLVCWIITRLLYWPFLQFGRFVDWAWDSGSHIPFYEEYKGLNLSQVEKDIWNRLTVEVEQRFRRAEILELRDTFREVVISDGLPYYHFLCSR